MCKQKRVYTEDEKRIMQHIREAQPHICFYCKKSLMESEITIDHMTPLNRGGKTEEGNLVIACEKCNHEKSDMTLEEYAQFTIKKFEVINHVTNEINNIKQQLLTEKDELKEIDEELEKLKITMVHISILKEKKDKLEKLKYLHSLRLIQLDEERQLRVDLETVLPRKVSGRLDDEDMRNFFYQNINIVNSTINIGEQFKKEDIINKVTNNLDELIPIAEIKVDCLDKQSKFKVINMENEICKVPSNAQYMLNIDSIKLPYWYESEQPDTTNEEAFYNANDAFNKPITIFNSKKSGFLLSDGYKNYITAKKMGVKYVPIIVSKFLDMGDYYKSNKDGGIKNEERN